jgi:hypothetical protein
MVFCTKKPDEAEQDDAYWIEKILYEKKSNDNFANEDLLEMAYKK